MVNKDPFGHHLNTRTEHLSKGKPQGEGVTADKGRKKEKKVSHGKGISIAKPKATGRRSMSRH